MTLRPGENLELSFWCISLPISLESLIDDSGDSNKLVETGADHVSQDWALTPPRPVQNAATNWKVGKVAPRYILKRLESYPLPSRIDVAFRNGSTETSPSSRILKTERNLQCSSRMEATICSVIWIELLLGLFSVDVDRSCQLAPAVLL